MALLDYATAQSFGLRCVALLWTPSVSCIDCLGRQHNPVGLGNHVGELLVKELEVLHARAVGSSLQRGINLVSAPRLGFELDRGTSLSVMVEEALRWVHNSLERREVLLGPPTVDKLGPTQTLQQLSISFDALT